MSNAMMRVGYPYLDVRLYENYSAFVSEQHYRLTEAVISTTLEYDMYGKAQGLIQFYDEQNVVKITDETIVFVSVSDFRQSIKYDAIFGVSLADSVLMNTGSDTKKLMIEPFHRVLSKRFNKRFEESVKDNIDEMLSDLYLGLENIMPVVKCDNIYIPPTVWVMNIDKYLEFVRKYGKTVETDMFVHAWYDFRGLMIKDHKEIMIQEPKTLVVVEEDYMGELTTLTDHEIVATNVEIPNLTKQGHKKKYLNAIYVSTSSQNKEVYTNIFGTGEHVEFISRGGMYEKMTYVNGFEEIQRITTMVQYDRNTTFRSYGNFSVFPCDILKIEDENGLFKEDHIVESITHEISNENSYTTIRTISNYDEMEEFEYAKEIAVQNTDTN